MKNLFDERYNTNLLTIAALSALADSIMDRHPDFFADCVCEVGRELELPDLQVDVRELRDVFFHFLMLPIPSDTRRETRDYFCMYLRAHVRHLNLPMMEVHLAARVSQDPGILSEVDRILAVQMQEYQLMFLSVFGLNTLRTFQSMLGDSFWSARVRQILIEALYCSRYGPRRDEQIEDVFLHLARISLGSARAAAEGRTALTAAGYFRAWFGEL
jgi:hypothetical protein